VISGRYFTHRVDDTAQVCRSNLHAPEEPLLDGGTHGYHTAEQEQTGEDEQQAGQEYPGHGGNCNICKTGGEIRD
jgi:hypothetical protein